MNWHGLLCSPESVRAYLAGTKTQTRRVVKLPKTIGDGYGGACWDLAKKPSYYKGSGAIFIDQGHPMESYPWIVECPHGVPGDGLYVREAFKVYGWDCYAHDGSEGHQWLIEHQADGMKCAAPDQSAAGRLRPSSRWRSGRYMPRWAARIFRELVEVRVERVQEISIDDAFAEGVFPTPAPNARRDSTWDLRYYTEVWDKLNSKRDRIEGDMGSWPADYGPYCWEANPWVWVLTTKETEQRP